MKTTNDSGAQRNRRAISAKPAVERIEGAAFAMLGVVGLCSMGVAVFIVASPATESARTSAKQLPLVKYLQSGQLMADVRTLAAVVSYVLQPEGNSKAAAIPPSLGKTNMA